MDANGMAVAAILSKTVWNTTDLEAAARDLVDVGIWEIAGQEERKKTAQEMAETQFSAARTNLTQAQAEHTRAICEFMEIQARWKAAAVQLPSAVPHPIRAANPLEAAETELRRAKYVYCLLLDQNQRMQHLLKNTRDAFHQAQENWEHLVILSEGGTQ